MLLAALDSAVTPCVPAAIEETTALGLQVPEVLVLDTEEAEALVLEAVAGADDKKALGRENNERQLSLQEVLKNFCDRFYNRCFWISGIALTSGLRKEIRYSRELGPEKAKRI